MYDPESRSAANPTHGSSRVRRVRLHVLSRQRLEQHRPKTVAIANDLPLYTVNPRDLDHIDGLVVVPIPHPDQE